jgi:hypothetical protein
MNTPSSFNARAMVEEEGVHRAVHQRVAAGWFEVDDAAMHGPYGQPAEGGFQLFDHDARDLDAMNLNATRRERAGDPARADTKLERGSRARMTSQYLDRGLRVFESVVRLVAVGETVSVIGFLISPHVASSPSWPGRCGSSTPIEHYS